MAEPGAAGSGVPLGNIERSRDEPLSKFDQAIIDGVVEPDDGDPDYDDDAVEVIDPDDGDDSEAGDDEPGEADDDE